MRFAPIGLVCALVVVTSACGGSSGSTGSSTNTPSPSPAPAPSSASYQNETGCITYALTSAIAQSGTDPWLARQWHLQNTGQTGGVSGEDMRAVATWTATGNRGSGVRVAVVDDAIEVTHPDLSPNVVDGVSFNYRAGVNYGKSFPLPCTTSDDHGTAVAGILAARDGNGIGGSGIASRSGLVGFNALATNLDTDIADALLRDTAQVGVYNNSWGSPDDGKLHASEATFQTAVATGIAQGRGGKGSIYVFPAGNGGCYAGSLNNDGSCVGQVDNANFDGYTNVLGVIAACAVSDRGTRPWYNESGANVLVCGSSSDRTANILTTDITGRSTANGPCAWLGTTLPNGYRCDFSGTSASTPMVSGVVSLMLAARPDLTWRDVRLILAETARKNDASNIGWTSNFGYNWHPNYSFGVANAQAAVARASNWTSVGNSATLMRCGPYRRVLNSAIGDAVSNTVAGGTIEDAQTVSAQDCPITRIEFIEVTFAATHTASGDLRVRLVSPNTLVSDLATSRICQGSCGNYGDSLDSNPWAFGSVRHLGESAAGTWRLQVTDQIPQDVGAWKGWSIRFWGR